MGVFRAAAVCMCSPNSFRGTYSNLLDKLPLLRMTPDIWTFAPLPVRTTVASDDNKYALSLRKVSLEENSHASSVASVHVRLMPDVAFEEWVSTSIEAQKPNATASYYNLLLRVVLKHNQTQTIPLGLRWSLVDRMLDYDPFFWKLRQVGFQYKHSLKQINNHFTD